MKTFLIDTGHGKSTRGKCSPDGRYCEWEGTRRLARRLLELSRRCGLDCRLLFDSSDDLPVGTRIELANGFDPRSSVLVSIHSNAAGDGSRWCNASGFSAFVAPDASVDATRLAALLVAEAGRNGLAGNRFIPSEGFWRARFAICTRTRCPAVLTENLFHDNRADLDILLSDEGVDRLARVHLAAFLKFLEL